MRRDLILGLILSILVHGGVTALGLHKSPAPPRPPKDADPAVQMVMPPLDPEDVEKTPPDESPEETTNQSPPPMLPELLQVAPLEVITQSPQIIPPDLGKPTPGILTIPQTQPGNKKFAEVFDPNKLDQQPVVRLQSKPVYPFEMRRSGQSGTVTVGFIVDANGDVQNVHAISSSQREFESAALQAVAKWKFRPGLRGGKAVATRMSVPMLFNIFSD